MKRLIVGLTILGVIVGLAVAGIFYTDFFVDEIISSLDSTRALVETKDFDKIKEICQKAKEDFNLKQKVFSLFLNHSLLEEAEETLNGLPDFATNDTCADFLSLLEKAKTNLTELKNSQKHIF